MLINGEEFDMDQFEKDMAEDDAEYMEKMIHEDNLMDLTGKSFEEAMEYLRVYVKLEPDELEDIAPYIKYEVEMSNKNPDNA